MKTGFRYITLRYITYVKGVYMGLVLLHQGMMYLSIPSLPPPPSESVWMCAYKLIRLRVTDQNDPMVTNDGQTRPSGPRGRTRRGEK